MRVWDVHPGYLSRNSLLGQHGEIHALHKVIVDKKKGYSRHPETLRWQENLPRLAAVHDLTVREMKLRGFRHHTPLETTIITQDQGELGFVDSPPLQFTLLSRKYQIAQTSGRIPLPLQGSDFWAQHKYSVMARGFDYYQEVQAHGAANKDRPIDQEQELIGLVQGIMAKPVREEALAMVIEQIWAQLAVLATTEEKETFAAWPPGDPGLMAFLYTLAAKYSHSLQQSTIFSDIE